MQVTWKIILRSVSEDPVKMNESFLFSLPVLSLCRSREKWTMNDERIIDLLATSAEPMQVTWKMNDERWTNHWSTRYQCWAYAGHVKNERWTMNERFTRRLGWQMNETLTRRHGREVNDSFICRIQIFRSFFHVTCIGSALVARENRNDSFILTGSSDTDLRIIFHVTCIGSEEETERICLPRSLSRG